MGLIDDWKTKIAKKRDADRLRVKNELVEQRNILSKQREVLAEQRAYQKEKSELSSIKREIRAQKLAPVTNALKGFGSAIKSVKQYQQKNLARQEKLGNNNLFGQTKSTDELFGFQRAEKKAPVVPEKKIKKVVYYK